MALLADKSGDAYSNIVNGTASSITFTVPRDVVLAVESVAATVDNGAATSAAALTATIKDSSGEVIAKVPLTSKIPAGNDGTATWALRLADSGSGQARHAGYYWSNNTAAAGVVGPAGNTYYSAVWDFMQNQWGDTLLDITNPALPKVLYAGLYTFSFEVRLITGHSVMGDYAGKTVDVFTVFNTVPAPLFGNMDIRFPMQIVRDWIYPTSSSCFACLMQAGDSFSGGFNTDQATLGANYRGFGDASIVMSYLDVLDVTP